jgi:hypothetical protein
LALDDRRESVELLPDEQATAFGRFAGEPAQARLARSSFARTRTARSPDSAAFDGCHRALPPPGAVLAEAIVRIRATACRARSRRAGPRATSTSRRAWSPMVLGLPRGAGRGRPAGAPALAIHGR